MCSQSITAQVTHFEDGTEAIKSLCGDRNAGVHLILIDLNLPKLGGLELLKLIRAVPRIKDVPVAIFTSSQSEKDRQEAQRLGANFYLPKPSDLEEFFRVVAATVLSLAQVKGQGVRCGF